MRWIGSCARAVVIVVAMTTVASAARARINFSVEIEPAGWRADALAAALRADLADDTMKVGAPAEVVIHGRIVGDELRWTMVRWGAPVRGVVSLANTDRTTVSGVLRDRLLKLVRPHHDVDAPESADVPAPGAVGGLVVLGALALVLGAPLVFARRALPKAWRSLKLVRGTLIGLVGLALAAVVLVVLGERVPEASAFVLVGGGLAWGTLAALLLPLAAPPLRGLHRIEHAEIGPVLHTWAERTAQRTLGLALVLVPAGAVLWLAGRALGVPTAVTFAVIAPIAGLVARHARRAVTEVLAARLDETLVDRADAEAWHAQVRGYVLGYLRRNNLEADGEVLDGMTFLPGTGDGVHVYGGGLTHTRVVIARPLLELALAPYGRPHDYAMPRVSTLHWTHWNAGLVMPTGEGDKLATKEQRQPAETVEEGEHERIALGEPPTLSGIIEPVAFDPRTSYRPGDDPLWLDWDPGEEHDGTDPGDRDFLFGVIVHAVGMIERHEDRGATFLLAWPALAKLAAKIARPQLGDTHAALNGARHHLVQYLAYRLWKREDLLTPRAFPPELERTSRAIYAELDRAADVDDVDRPWRARLRHLRMFALGAPPERTKRQRLAIAGALLAGAAVIAVLVVQAFLYHSTYEQRLAKQTERSTDGK